MKRYVIVVAGGKGLRMGGELPKQFLPLGGRPLLMHTLTQFYHTDATIQIVLVLPQEQIAFWSELCTTHAFATPHQVVAGGDSRFASVKNGLDTLPHCGVVAVHDGVRPFVSSEVIEQGFTLAAQQGAVIPTLPVIDSLRCVVPPTLSPAGHSVERSNYLLVQTPQVFRANILHHAYEQPYKESFTDDASVVEAAGYSITPIAGNRENIKITTPFDMTIASALIAANNV